MEDQKYRGYFFLGGQTLENIDAIESMLEDFWLKYEVVEPGCRPLFPKRTIGFYIHGNEGRGQVKRPLLIIAFQCIIGWTGASNTNSIKCLG